MTAIHGCGCDSGLPSSQGVDHSRGAHHGHIMIAAAPDHGAHGCVAWYHVGKEGGCCPPVQG